MDNPCRDIDVLLFEGVNLLDVAGPVQAFTSASDDGVERYRLRYVSLDGGEVAASCGLRIRADAVLTEDPVADLLVPGGDGVDMLLDHADLQSRICSRAGAGGERRVISVCSGALLLAAAGVLDDRRATTHWGRADLARERFPQVRWDTDALYHIDGPVMTSAGVTAGIDLALEIIRLDCGPSVALSVARELVVYLKRAGGQNQFADLLEAQFAVDREVHRLMAAFQRDPAFGWTLESMADAAGLTPRTLSRRFTAAIGLTPVKFLERYRVKRAADVLSGGAPVDKAIGVSGFADFQQMQRAFKRQLGTTVGSFRDNFSAAT